MNKAILMGRLCADPEFRQTNGGIPCCRFRLAINRPKTKDGNQETDFINVVAWRQKAEFVSRYFHKGNMMLVEGQFRNNDYTDKDGTKHYQIEVLADEIHFCESKQQDATGAADQYQQAPPPQYPAASGYPPQYQQATAPPPQYPQQYQAPPQYGAVPPPNGNPYHPQ